MAKTSKEATAARLPDKFTKLTPEMGGLWWRPEGSSMIEGLLKGRHELTTPQGRRTYYQIQLSADASWKSAEGELITAAKDAIINLGHRAGLTPLDGLPQGTQVGIVVKGKVVTKKGTPCWDMEVGAVILPDKPPF